MTLPFDQTLGLSHPFSVGKNVHSILGNPNSAGTFYADIAARDADTDFQVLENVGKAVAISSPLSIYTLMSVGPSVWLSLGTADPIDTFLELTDVLESTYTGFALNAVRVNAAETGLEFTTDDAGNVINVGGSTDNALARFDLATGKLIQNSVALLDDAGFLLGLTGLSVLGQVGIGTGNPDAAALLDLVSTTLGFYPMRMTTAERDAIASPPTGLQIDNITTNSLERFNGAIWVGMASSGDMFGPGSSVDKSMPGFSGVTGKIIFDPDSAKIDTPGISLNPTKSLYQEVYPNTDGQVLALSLQDQLDRSPFGNDLLLFGSALIVQGAGRIGKGLRLDGTNATLGRVLTNSSLEFNDLLSVEFWMFPNTNGAAFHPVVSKIDAGLGKGWNVVYQNNSIRITLRDDTTPTDYTVGAGLVPTSTWSLIGFTLNDSTLEAKVYINGVLIDTRTIAQGYTDSGDDLIIGNRLSNGNPNTANFYDGDVSNVRVYNRVLELEEIRTHYLR